MNLEEQSRIIKHIWSEPRGVAEMEWQREYGLSVQIERQVGREAMEQFASGGGWPDPEAKLHLVMHEPPDWDWWEPTTEWRRRDAYRRACP